MGKLVKTAPKTTITEKNGSPSRTSTTPFSQSIHSVIDRILTLQRSVGNRAVRDLFKSGALQAKLKIGQTGDIYEQEAERLADVVTRMPVPKIQRQTEEEQEALFQTKLLAEEITPLVQRQVEEEEIIQPKQASGMTRKTAPVLESRIQNLKGGGRPLPAATRAFFEARFGCSFGKIRVHTDKQAAAITRALNAQAFTMGHDVVFAQDKYSPETKTGKRLLAHELTHAVQQRHQDLFSHPLQKSPAPNTKLSSYFQDPQKAFKRYETLKKSLNRDLRLIGKTRNKKRKKARQIKFLRRICDHVLGHNPFKIIDVRPLKLVKSIIKRRGQSYILTTSTNAVTELVAPRGKNKEVKVTFNEEVFKDSLESIIATALHESVHARQLKSTIPARSFHYGPRKDYYAAVNALSELEAYTIEVHSPFFGKLPLTRQKQLKGFLGQAEKIAIAAIKKMNIDLSQYYGFQNMLNKLVPEYKGLKAWFKSHPLKWARGGGRP